ncbi:hypothetical protein [Halalkalibacter nanhaiisediminis]|uniref:hypothetical protein n=1 Tax=Halalkalibacter nanhaiisediminis TaxID=688079 RepID=UPI00119DB726|nr:hypothetical protein [Halalkalibacter nanhaiisediminis]
MKSIEWLVVLGFVTLGIACLTFSATWMLPDTHQHLGHTFFTICLYAIIPLSCAAAFFLFFKYRRKKESRQID